MTVEVETLPDADRWNELVEGSPHGTVFHRRGFLDAIAEQAGATLLPLAGYVGQEPVGVFPVFALRKGPVRAAFSPPPDLKVSYGGPALCNQEALSRRKAERRNRRFVEAALDRITEEIGPRYVHLRTGVRYGDTRPFEWAGFEATPGYTYEVALDRDPDAVFEAFSGDARSNVRRARDADADVTVSVGGRAEIEPIVEQVRARHAAQDEPYHVTPAFATALHDRLPAGSVRPYVVRVDGDFAGGMVTLWDDDAVYRWQGGAKPGVDLPINDSLDWHVIRDAINEGRPRYDLVGANNRRLVGYKAKFAPELRSYVSLEDGGLSMRAAAKVYRKLR